MYSTMEPDRRNQAGNFVSDLAVDDGQCVCDRVSTEPSTAITADNDDIFIMKFVHPARGSGQGCSGLRVMISVWPLLWTQPATAI
jgi:hypothetical protein